VVSLYFPDTPRMRDADVWQRAMKLKFSDKFVIYTFIDLKTNRIIVYVLFKIRIVQGNLEEESIKKTLHSITKCLRI